MPKGNTLFYPKGLSVASVGGIFSLGQVVFRACFNREILPISINRLFGLYLMLRGYYFWGLNKSKNFATYERMDMKDHVCSREVCQ